MRSENGGSIYIVGNGKVPSFFSFFFVVGRGSLFPNTRKVVVQINVGFLV